MLPEPISQPSDAPSIDLHAELEETERALGEISLLIEQSQVEVAKLSQRNATITAHLQQMGDTAPLNEWRLAYQSALEAQQRLFVMRGQLEKLQSDKTHLERYRNLLRYVLEKQEKHRATAESSPASTDLQTLVNALEAERQRLSRQMHDGPAQALSNFILQAEIAMRLMDVDPEQARQELLNLKASAMSTFQKVRNFIFEMRPMMLDDLGLLPTVRRYAETLKEQHGIEINIVVSGTEQRFENYLEVLIFRVIQELLGNAARHSQATQVKVVIDFSPQLLRVTVDDNGRGFDPAQAMQGSGSGLKLLRERVEQSGGRFEVDSAPGKGTRIHFEVPISRGSVGQAL
ncbi:MAG: ATP-binding protein [Anaerolineales bacterium]